MDCIVHRGVEDHAKVGGFVWPRFLFACLPEPRPQLSSTRQPVATAMVRETELALSQIRGDPHAFRLLIWHQMGLLVVK